MYSVIIFSHPYIPFHMSTLQLHILLFCFKILFMFEKNVVVDKHLSQNYLGYIILSSIYNSISSENNTQNTDLLHDYSAPWSKEKENPTSIYIYIYANSEDEINHCGRLLQQTLHGWFGVGGCSMCIMAKGENFLPWNFRRYVHMIKHNVGASHVFITAQVDCFVRQWCSNNPFVSYITYLDWCSLWREKNGVGQYWSKILVMINSEIGRLSFCGTLFWQSDLWGQ